MMLARCSRLLICVLVISAASDGEKLPAAEPIALASPDGKLRVTFELDDQGRSRFSVARQGRSLVTGSLGLDLAGSGPLGPHLRVVEVRRRGEDTTYAIPVGKASSARDRHNEMVVALEETVPPRRRLELAFRAWDDGVAFRYQVPAGGIEAPIALLAEQTRFQFPASARALALPLKDFTTSYEAYYKTMPVAAMPPDQLHALPILIDQPAGPDGGHAWMAITEANLTRYAGMYLAAVGGEPGTLAARLSPLPGRSDGARVVADAAPFASPWRVIMIADDPGRLIESNLVFHLSDPPAIAETSWIKPGKTLFPWWNGYVDGNVPFTPGVNTATMKHYIDFAAAHGIPYHSLDGLDIAWYGGPIQPDGPTDITRAAPSIDMPELLRYARAKNVRLRVWLHWKALRPQIDEAFRVYEEWGIEGVMVDFMDRDDQEMVAFYHEMAEKAARHHLTLTLHGAYKPTGMERTWPNVLTYEAALNQEYNKWEQPGQPGTPPRHNLDIAFVRMLAGPLDYHQGGMRNVLPAAFKPRDKAPPVQGTRGHQLAMYVVYQNHLPMLADYPEAYRDQGGLDFLVNVPATWDETRVLHAQVGDSLVVARRKGEAWYVGGMIAGAARDLTLRLPLSLDRPFRAELYLDDPEHGPTRVVRRDQQMPAGSTLTIPVGEDGGFAARITPGRSGD